MQTSITAALAGLAGEGIRIALRPILRALGDRFSSQTLTSGALVISAGGATTAKVGSVYYGVANGKLVTLAANTAMPALVGTVANALFNVFVFSVNSVGALTTQAGVAASSLAGVQFPTPTEGNATIGFVIVNPTVGTFIGGTTPLDGTGANAIYINTVGAFDASVTP